MEQDPLIPDNWLSAGAAARLAGVDVRTIRRWADSGMVPCRRLGTGGHRRISQRGLQEVLVRPKRAAGRRGSAQPPHDAVTAWADAVLDWFDWKPPPGLTDDDLAMMQREIREVRQALDELSGAVAAELRQRDDRAGPGEWRGR